MKSITMRARFKGKCIACGASVAAGELIYYSRESRTVRCMACGPHTGHEPKKEPRKRGRRGEPTPAPTPTPEPEPAPDEPQDQPKLPPGPMHVAVDMASCQVAERGPDGVHRYLWQSVEEIVEDAFRSYATTPNNCANVDQTQMKALSGYDVWGDRYTKERLLAELVDPPKQIVKAIEEMKGLIEDDVDAPRGLRRRVRHGCDWGEEPDADRYLAADPNFWDRNERVEAPKKVLTIACNVTVNCKRTRKDLLFRGAAVAALADVLVARGYSVEILAITSAADPTSTVTRTCSTVVVKSSRMPLDPGSVAMALCSIAFCRTVVLAAEKRHLPGNLCWSWGSSAPVPNADKAGIDYLIEENVFSREEAAQWVAEQVNKTTELEESHA